MIRIEIIAVAPDSITVALYYPVPDAVYSSVAVDTDRVPAGNGLSPAEVAELKQGRIFELVKTVDPVSKTQQEARTFIENLWRESAQEAKTEYIRLYSYVNFPDIVGRTWDSDGNWS